ncbi:MAG: phosphoheptose isomerase, partial [candidate division Zixibacteria bacterium]|nr:phosphoheptose isomerase [candidate division Zixibacteria bacterium]
MNEDVRLAPLKKAAEDSAILRRAVVDQLGLQILDLAAVISGVIGAGGKLLIAGNGGSASGASHFA